ncbi:hypothetical protein AB0V79_27360 [Mesorhizobium ciceri]|uniref:hypothetical protein n=1 Tax=Mesorhizobium ciceri TaxID=39645 RepID=UPI0007A94D15|nr:hypothetical protein [Mesorhizobium ciceri]AMY00670.1 hypothetical protein A4R29_15065 [Mesorhizobium ciceri biovar biserrulae]
MSGKARVRAKRNEGRINHRPDGAADKRFPNGISSTVRAIYVNWNALHTGQQVGDEILDPESFCEKTDFVEVFEKVASHYPGIRKRPSTKETIATMLDDIDAGGRINLSFYQLRAIAQFVGLDTGLFLLFTQFVSNERRTLDEHGRDPRAQALEMIRKIKGLFDHLDEVISNKGANLPIFTSNIRPNEHIVDISMLKLWCDAYNQPGH